MSHADDLKLLGLPADPDVELVKARFRELAHQKHPDKGGDPGEMSELTAAYRRVLSKVELEVRRCKTCHATGTVKVARGLFHVDIKCPDCKGTGERK